jgi:hypothetical protein
MTVRQAERKGQSVIVVTQLVDNLLIPAFVLQSIHILNFNTPDPPEAHFTLPEAVICNSELMTSILKASSGMVTKESTRRLLSALVTSRVLHF